MILLWLMFFFQQYGISNYIKNGFNSRWYVIGNINQFPINKPTKIIFNGNPLAVWRDPNNIMSAVSDICPHRGAALSKGRIDYKTNSIVCPYHTFKFSCKGRMIQTPGSHIIRNSHQYNLKTDVPYFNIIHKGDWVFLQNFPQYEITLNTMEDNIWIEPEYYDSSFRSVYLSKVFESDVRTVTENSLDILHISEVHTFGNKKNPLPISDKIEKIDDNHYKIIYEYKSGKDSMANKLFGIDNLIVENEFILPHYTVARVKFGKFVNTIVTSASPVDENKTILYVKAYRNNWVFNNFPFLNALCDKITENMMVKTLSEDKAVIDTIYPKYRDGNFITKYDEFTKLYRDSFTHIIFKTQE